VALDDRDKDSGRISVAEGGQGPAENKKRKRCPKDIGIGGK
jgi:hypothetical protein